MIMNMLKLGFVTILYACTSSTVVFSISSIPIEVHISDRFTIEFDSNVTTGYRQVFELAVDDNILRLVNSDYISFRSKLTGAVDTQI